MENLSNSFVDKAKMALQQNIRWAGIIVVMGYIAIGLMLLLAIGIHFFGSFGQAFDGMSVLMSVIYLLSAGLYYLPTKKLKDFTKGCQQALMQGDEDAVVDGLQALSGAFRLVVIYALVVIGLYALVIVGVLIGLGAGFMSDLPSL